MNEILQLRAIIQPSVSVVAALVVLWRPWTAVGIYLFGYSLPYVVTGGSAPIMWPQWTLGIPLAINAAWRLTRPAGGVRGAGFESLVLLLVLVLVVASVRGGEPYLDGTMLGLLFLLNARAMVDGPRHGVALATGAVLAWALLLAAHFFRVGSAATSADAFDEAAYAVTGDRNYRAFFLGCGAMVAWAWAFEGVPWLTRQSRIRRMLARVGALGAALFVCYVMVLFQSRGMVLALAAGGVAALVRHRPSVPRLCAAAAALGAVVYLLALSPASEAFMSRFRQADLRTANQRADIMATVGEAFGGQGVLNQLVGMGHNWILQKFEFSPHNSFMRVLVEEGVLGLAVLIAILGACAWRSWSRRDPGGGLAFPLLVYLSAAALSIEPHLHTAFWIGLSVCAARGVASSGADRDVDGSVHAWGGRYA